MTSVATKPADACGAHPAEGWAISGMGAVSCLGVGCDALREALAAGRDGLAPIDRFSTDGFSVHLAGLVPGMAPAARGEARCAAFAETAAREALARARFDPARCPPHRLGLVVGTSLGDQVEGIHRIAEVVGDAVGARGPRLTVSTACAASTNAIGLACDLLASGAVDAVLAGGADVLTLKIFAGFHSLGVLSAAACAPFSEPFGTTLGEGAGFLLLESPASARARAVTPAMAVLGYGLSTDAHHATSPDPKGSGVARALRAALADARIAADGIDYVNAHGTGTRANDAAEWSALRLVFGAHADGLLVSSTKGHLGHAQGAAGVLEIISTLLCLEQGAVPPTLRFRGPRPGGPLDPVGQATPRKAPVRHAVAANSAFGGCNAAVVLGPPSAPAERRARRVIVRGLGAVGAFGSSAAELERALDTGLPLAPAVQGFSFERIVRGVDPRGLDPSTMYLTAAVALGLAEGGLDLRGAARDRAGLFVGTSRASPASDDEFEETLARRGPQGVSALAFSRLVLNAAAGHCARLLSLKGANTTVSMGEGSGLLATAHAAEALAWRTDCDLLAAAGYEELRVSERIPGSGEGAACVLLEGTERVQAGAVELAGWAIAGPSGGEEAIHRALAMAALPGDEIDLWIGAGRGIASAPGLEGTRRSRPEEVVGCSTSYSSAIECAAAVLALRRRPGAVLVSASGGRSAAVALVFQRRGET